MNYAFKYTKPKIGTDSDLVLPQVLTGYLINKRKDASFNE